MTLNASKFALAAASSVAIIWALCSLIVMLIPDMSMHASGYMMHADFSAMQWQMHFTGFFIGLILWSVAAGVFAWLMATIYNRLLQKGAGS